MKRALFCAVICVCFMVSTVFAEQNACKSWMPAMIGGPAAQGNNTLSIRWLGGANIELTYNNQVVLLSAWFNRGPRSAITNPLGFTAEDIKRADAIFLGHGHFDHMSDAAQVALQTGAPVYAPKFAYEKLLSQDVKADQLRYVHSGDVFQFNGFTVEAFHILHSGVGTPAQNPPDVARAFSGRPNGLVPVYYAGLLPELLPEALEEESAIQAKGANDPGIRTEGVVAYLFTFGKDFTFIFYDSSNPNNTDEAKSIMARIGGKSDIATLGYQGGPAWYAIQYITPVIELFNPRFFFPSHHDAAPGGYFDMPTEPLMEAIKINQKLANTTPISVLYRQPLCFDVKNHRMADK